MTSPKKKIGAVASSRRPYQRGIAAGLLIVALGGAAVWWFVGGRGATRPTGAGRDRARPDRIATVSPHIATNRPAAKEPAVQPALKELPPQIAGEIRNGYRLLANGKLHKVVGVHTSRVARTTLAMKTFDHPGNQTIASLLTITPGDSLLGDSSMYFQDFDQHFRESAEEKIEIRPDDPDDVRELKECVIATRKELQEMLDRGEDIVKVMRESREQMRELGLYREELSQQVKKIADDLDKDLSEKDLHDLVDAANKMLEERGSQPLMLTAPLLYQLREDKIDSELEKLERQEEQK